MKDRINRLIEELKRFTGGQGYLSKSTRNMYNYPRQDNGTENPGDSTGNVIHNPALK